MLHLGTGSADITPKVGAVLSGFIARENRPSTHVDSPLQVRVLVIRDQGQHYFLFNYDLLGIGPGPQEQILSRLEAGLGPVFSPNRCLLTATHTHSGPVTSPLSGEAPPDPAYLDLLCERSLEASRAALLNIQPVYLYTTTLRLPGLTYNRRAVLVDGRVSISPEPDLPVVERGPLDDRLTVLVWRSPAGQNVAAAVHFACHGVSVMTQGIGSDIPGQLAGRIGAALGAPCLYLQGAAGDINPTTVTSGWADLLAWIERAMELLQGFETRLQPVETQPFLALSGDLSLDYAPLPGWQSAEKTVRDLERIAAGEVDAPDLRETLRSFKNTMNMRPEDRLDPAKAGFVALALARAGRRTLEAIQAGGANSLPLRLAAWRMGNLVLVFVAAEVFAATGLRLQALRPDLQILPVSYLAPLAGYLPDRRAISLGGYEVDDAWRFYGHPAPFMTDSEERLLKEVGLLAAF